MPQDKPLYNYGRAKDLLIFQGVPAKDLENRTRLDDLIETFLVPEAAKSRSLSKSLYAQTKHERLSTIISQQRQIISDKKININQEKFNLFQRQFTGGFTGQKVEAVGSEAEAIAIDHKISLLEDIESNLTEEGKIRAPDIPEAIVTGLREGFTPTSFIARDRHELVKEINESQDPDIRALFPEGIREEDMEDPSFLAGWAELGSHLIGMAPEFMILSAVTAGLGPAALLARSTRARKIFNMGNSIMRKSKVARVVLRQADKLVTSGQTFELHAGLRAAATGTLDEYQPGEAFIAGAVLGAFGYHGKAGASFTSKFFKEYMASPAVTTALFTAVDVAQGGKVDPELMAQQFLAFSINHGATHWVHGMSSSAEYFKALRVNSEKAIYDFNISLGQTKGKARSNAKKSAAFVERKEKERQEDLRWEQIFKLPDTKRESDFKGGTDVTKLSTEDTFRGEDTKPNAPELEYKHKRDILDNPLGIGMEDTHIKAGMSLTSFFERNSIPLDKQDVIVKNIKSVAGNSADGLEFLDRIRKFVGQDKDMDSLSNTELMNTYQLLKYSKPFGEPGQVKYQTFDMGTGEFINKQTSFKGKDGQTRFADDPNMAKGDMIGMLTPEMASTFTKLDQVKIGNQLLTIDQLSEPQINQLIEKMQSVGKMPFFHRESNEHFYFVDSRPDLDIKAVEFASFLSKLPEKERLEIGDNPTEAMINTFANLKDIFGESNLDVKKLGNIVNLTKRMQIPTASGTVAEDAFFSELVSTGKMSMIDNKAVMNVKIIPDAKDIEMTDGKSYMRNDVFDAYVRALGLPEGTDILKSFGHYNDKNQDAIGIKTAIWRADAVQEKQMQSDGTHYLVHDSAAKYQGTRSRNVFQMPVTSFRNKFGVSFKESSPTINMFRQMMYYTENKDMLQNIKDRSVKLNKEISSALSSPEAWKKWVKEKVFKKEEELDTWEDKIYDVQDGVTSADKLMSAFDFNPIMQQLHISKAPVLEGIKNYLRKSLVQPRFKGTSLVIAGSPERFIEQEVAPVKEQKPIWTFEPMSERQAEREKRASGRDLVSRPDSPPLLAARGKSEAILALHGRGTLEDAAREIKVARAFWEEEGRYGGRRLNPEMEKAIVDAELTFSQIEAFLKDKGKKKALKGRTKTLTDDNIILGSSASELSMDMVTGVKVKGKTLGEHFKRGGDPFEIVIARSPIENKGGIRTLLVTGVDAKSERSGMSVFMSPKNMRFLGGADNDIDKVGAFFNVPESYKREVMENRDYLGAEVKKIDSSLSKGAQRATLASIFDPVTAFKQGQRNLQAKTSIGKVMSLDRRLRTMKEHGLFNIPDNMDEIMLKWKRKSVDSAKYGGMDNYRKVYQEILSDLGIAPMGPTGAAARANFTERGRSTQDLYRFAYGRDYENNKKWEWDEVERGISDYFEDTTPIALHEHALKLFNDVSRGYEPSVLQMVSIPQWTKVQESRTGRGGGKGVLHMAEALEKHGLNTYTAIDKLTIVPSEVIKSLRAAHVRMSKTGSDMPRDVIDRLKDPILGKIELTKLLSGYNEMFVNDMYDKASEGMTTEWTKHLIGDLKPGTPEYNAMAQTLLSNQKQASSASALWAQGKFNEAKAIIEKTNSSDNPYRRYFQMALLGSVTKRTGKPAVDRVLKIGWLNDYVDADIMKEIGTRTNHVFEFAKYREKPLPKDTKKAEDQVKQEAIKKELSDDDILEKRLNNIRKKDHEESVTRVSRMIRKASVSRDKLNQLKTKMMEMTKGQFMTEGEALAFILATSGENRTGRLTNFDKHPLTKKEVNKILEAVDRFEGSQKFTESGFLSKFLLKTALPKTVAAATPVTRRMYERTVHLIGETERVMKEGFGYIDKGENTLHKGSVNKEITEKAFMRYVLSDRTDTKDISEGDKIIFDKVYLGDYGTVDKPIEGSVKWLFNHMWDVTLDGMYHQLRVNGISHVEADATRKDAKKKWFNKAYWPGYVTNLEDVLMRKAEARISNKESVEDIKHVGKHGHTKKKTLTIEEQKKFYQHGFKEVLTTSLKDALDYSERQRQTLMVNEFLTELENSSGKYTEADIKGWNSFFNYWKVWTDDTLGYAGRVRNPKVFSGPSGFYIQYSDWNGNVRNKPISVKDGTDSQQMKEAQRKVQEFARHAKYKANLARYMTGTLVNLSFAKYIGWKPRSAVRNLGQRYLPVIAVAGIKDFQQSGKWLKRNETEAIKIFDRAGLGFGLSVGETDLIKHSMRDVLWTEEAKARVTELQKAGKPVEAFKENVKRHVEKFLQWGMRTSGNLAQSGSKFRGIRGSNEEARALSFQGVEEGNRRRAFIAGFAPVFETELDNFIRAGASPEQAKIKAEKLAMEAGKNMVIMTQFDYHTFAKPAALRGNKKKMWLMFKTFSWNYYKLNKDIIRDGYKAATGQYGNEEDIRRVARLMFLHSAPRMLTSILGKAIPLELAYYFTDDTYVVLKDLYKLFTTGQLTRYMFYGAGPLSVLSGAVAGNIVDLATVTSEDRDVNEAVRRAIPIPNAFKDVMKVLDGFQSNNSLMNYYRVAQLFGAPPKTYKEKGDIDENRFLY